MLVVERNSAKLTTMESDAEAEVLRLDNAWNEAYRRHERAPLERILADDFTALTPSGESITKASLMVNPSETASSVTFSEQAVNVFGNTAITRGRLQLDLNHHRVDQRFLRVFTYRNGNWRAVSVAVTPLASQASRHPAVLPAKSQFRGISDFTKTTSASSAWVGRVRLCAKGVGHASL
jgi:ketosteroid isomerase-like protein